MLITGIERQRNNKKRFSVFIDGEFAFGISDVDLLFYKLEAGAELSKERYDKLSEELLFAKARERAFEALSYRARTQKEMMVKLKEEQYPEDIIARVMELLIEYNYINDFEYAQNYVRSKVKLKGHGAIRLKYELRQKGVEASIIDDIINELDDEDVIETALGLLERKLRGDKDIDWKEKRRGFDFLLRKGYSPDIINKAYARYFETDTNDR